jgi:hypothetical protein
MARFRLSVYLACALFCLWFWLAVPTWIFGLTDMMEAMQ